MVFCLSESIDILLVHGLQRCFDFFDLFRPNPSMIPVLINNTLIFPSHVVKNKYAWTIETTHPSHFSIPEAIEYTNSLDPKPEHAFIVGFCHTVDHYDEDAKMRALDSESHPKIRIAYDGQRISF